MLVLAIPTVAFSGMFAMILGYTVPAFPGAQWVSPVLGTVMYLWGGRPFLTGAISEIRSRAPGMMLLIGLAITVAFVSSWGASLGLLHHQLDFWWELALLIVIMLLGHWIEMRSLAQTTSALDSLAALLPDEAERVVGDGANNTETVPPSELRVGDVVVVRPGGSVPADGRVVDGSADVDESMVTGESRPVRRGVGDQVVAGTVATDSGLRVAVTAVGDDTTLAGIRRLVTEAQNSSSRAQRLADKAAGWLFWFALSAGIVTAAVWGLLGQPQEAVVRTITVLVIACPHALGLAIPLVVSIATERAARGGVLIKDRLALESMRTVGAVLFDKTGTLTKGEPAVTAIATTGGAEEAAASRAEDDVLALAAAAESDSEHPLARAIVEAARRRGLSIPPSSGFSSSPAVGVTAEVGGRRVRVGGPRLLEEAGRAEMPDVLPWRDEGAIVLHVLVDDAVVGALKLADEVRPESRQAVDALHKLGIEVVMITGDAESVARAVADDLGIERVFAGVRPEDKSAKVAELAAGGAQGGVRGGRRERRSGNCGRGRRRWGGHRDRRGYRRGDRVGGRDPGEFGSALGAVGDLVVEGDVPQDEAEPLVGSGIQPDLGAARGGCTGTDRVRVADVGRRDLDVGLDGGGGAECPTAAPSGPAARGRRGGRSLRIWLGFRANRCNPVVAGYKDGSASQQTFGREGGGV